MINTTDLLQQHYHSFFEEDDDWVFFCNLADYVSLVLELEELKPTLESLFKEREEVFHRYYMAENAAFVALLLTRNELKKVIKKEKITDEGLDYMDDEIQKLIDGRLATTASNAEHVYEQLYQMCKRIDQLGRGDAIEIFYKDDGGFKRTTFRKLLEPREKCKARYDKEKNLKRWGRWNHMLIAREVVLFADEKMEEMAENDPLHMKRLNYSCYISRMRDIRDKKPQDRRSSTLFQKTEYKIYLNQMHHYFLKELMKPSTKQDIDGKIRDLQLSFDLDKESKVWIEGQAHRKWSMVRAKELTGIGRVMKSMLENAGEACVPHFENRDTLENLWVSLGKKFDRSHQEIKSAFFKKGEKWGIKKEVFSEKLTKKST